MAAQSQTWPTQIKGAASLAFVAPTRLLLTGAGQAQILDTTTGHTLCTT
jgi:hypothetical protein